MRRLSVVLMVVIVACGVVACGDDDARPKTATTGYVAEVQAAGAQVQSALADISDQDGGEVTNASYGAALDQSVAALDRAVKALGAATPPANAKAAHAKLVEGCRELADAFRATAVAARKNDPAALAEALKAVSAGGGSRKIAEAQGELKALGIQLGD
jgi:hypothetical protein